MPPHQHSDWKHLAEQASKEMDSTKLLSLITELNRVLGGTRRALLPQKPLDGGRPHEHGLGRDSMPRLVTVRRTKPRKA